MPQAIAELTEHHALAGLTFEQGRGGQTVCRVRTEHAEADVYLHGAHVTRFKPHQPIGGDDVLFLSEHAVFDGSTAIRGGIPICFPWFGGNGPRDDSPSHGFARTRSWSLAKTERMGDDVALTFVLVSTESTRELWDHDFVFTYTVRVGRSLKVSASVTNVGDAPLRYELALHTYLKVANVRNVTLTGFDGASYIDQLKNNETLKQAGEPTIDAEVDRIYQGHTSDVTVRDAGRVITVSKTGGDSTVLWNPHVAKAKRMSDFGDEEWPGMLCVESAAIGKNGITLASGKSHALTIELAARAG